MNLDTAHLPLETERLLLREFIESDWQAMLHASDAKALWWFDEQPWTEETARAWIADAIAKQHDTPRQRYILAVVLKVDSKTIGYCDLLLRSPLECRMAYSGFRYIPECWGKGYGTEALAAILSLAFDQLNLHRVSCICEPENVGSWRIMEKCGMRREGYGIQDHWIAKREEWVDTYYYAILKEDWEKNRLPYRERS